LKEEELIGFRNINSNLQGHPDMRNISGVDMSTGSLRTRFICSKWNGVSWKIR